MQRSLECTNVFLQGKEAETKQNDITAPRQLRSEDVCKTTPGMCVETQSGATRTLECKGKKQSLQFVEPNLDLCNTIKMMVDGFFDNDEERQQGYMFGSAHSMGTMVKAQSVFGTHCSAAKLL